MKIIKPCKKSKISNMSKNNFELLTIDFYLIARINIKIVQKK